jgi:hypothetical protein
VKGKVGTFHGKAQLVIEQLERLDPGPITESEFAWTPAPAAAKEEKPAAREREEHHASRARLSKRLERLLENPQLAQALDTFVAHLEKALDAQRAGGVPAAADKPEHTRERRERKPRGPRVEHKGAPASTESAPPKPPEPKRDPSLPEGLAFKPFNALVGSEGDAGKGTP